MEESEAHPEANPVFNAIKCDKCELEIPSEFTANLLASIFATKNVAQRHPASALNSCEIFKTHVPCPLTCLAWLLNRVQIAWESPPALHTNPQREKMPLPSKPSADVEGLTTYFPPKDKEDFPESQTTLLNNLDQSQLISLWPCFYIWSALYLKVALLNGDVRERA